MNHKYSIKETGFCIYVNKKNGYYSITLYNHDLPINKCLRKGTREDIDTFMEGIREGCELCGAELILEY